MSRRCPPGVLCIENITLFMLFLILISILFYIFFVTRKEQTTKHVVIKENNLNNNNPRGLFPRPSFSFSNITNDILLNPYSAPLRDDRYVNHTDGGGIRGIPINIQTNAIDTTYRQVGILTRNNSSEMILPLMGRPLFTSRDKWNFYTISDKNIKLPVSFKNKSCTNEYGCDNLYNGDNVYVDGLNDTFKVTMYDNNVMKYIPFL